MKELRVRDLRVVVVECGGQERKCARHMRGVEEENRVGDGGCG